MKIFKIFTTAVGILALSTSLSAQHDHSSMGGGSGSNMNSNMNMNNNSKMMMLPPKTEILKVWGKCEMCKARIEKIALASGATSADWNIKTKFLTIVYNPGKSSQSYVSDKLVKAGHDTGLRSAKDKAYNALPDCCKYERIR